MAASAKSGVSFFTLRNEIKNHKFRPIYVLQGEESYYIDKLSDLIVDAALTEDERDFNLTIAYGMDVADIKSIISACRQYPVMAQRQVVVLREAQNVGKANNKGNANELNLLKFYAEKPLQSTILVVCFKGGSMKAAQFTNALKKAGSGIVFTSDKVRDWQLAKTVMEYCSASNVNIDEKAASMLADAIGSDLTRLFAEVDKLKILLGKDNRITPQLIEQNIGISKEYNNFELEDALIARNALKAYRIIDYYQRNPKNNPAVMVVSALFGFFSNVLLVNTSRDRSDQGLMAAVNNRSPFRLKKFKQAAMAYNTRSCVNIMGYIRECDMKSKGQGSRQDAYDLLKELIYKILHS